jgi:ABC-type multidrug transport system fused ATPase/permease subunit
MFTQFHIFLSTILSIKCHIDINQLLYNKTVRLFSQAFYKTKIIIVFRLCNFTGSNFTNINYSLTDVIRKPIITLLIVGCISLLCGYIRVTFSNISAERQTRTIRQILFQSILKKDIVYFDQHKTGELNSHLTDNVNKICSGIGDKLSSAIETISTFISCIIVGKDLFYMKWKQTHWLITNIGFLRGWKLSLVVLSLTPVIFLTITLLFKVRFSSTSKYCYCNINVYTCRWL